MFMSRLKIALLGPPEIKINGSSLKTDRRKAIALLAYLAVTGKPQPRDHLAGLLWPDYERDSAYAYLRRTLWELNQILGKGWINAEREQVSLEQNSNLWLDTTFFQEPIQLEADESTAFVDAVDLYRGEFLEGFSVADTAPFEDWQFQQIEYFRREFASMLKKLIVSYEQAGEFGTALPHARRWLSLDPLNETAHRAIMRLLAEMGDRTGAIRQYETCFQTLETELGISPQAETKELYEAILQGDIRETHPTQEIPTSSEKDTPPTRLPVLPTPFIGRRPEVAQIKELVLNPMHRHITLIGPGGTGKTRLAIQSASEMADEFFDGVFFASLAPVKTADGVLPTVAKALDFSFYRNEQPRQQLLDFLREKHLLLILDNFEHLLEATELVRDILANATDVKLLVTSRIRLNLQGEQLFRVTGMRAPDAVEFNQWDDPEIQAKPFSAVQLFLDRARRVQPGFTLTKENLPPVMEICQLVQGMPLGLELAASWLELLPADEVATEISRSLDFLETDQPDVPDRQHSIRAVFESSWQLLNKAEQSAFLRLCVFVGSFSREAAQQVGGVPLRTLLGLANKSWLQQTDKSRFQLHELMRQYGEERLQLDESTWRDAKSSHAEYFADFVAEQSKKMQCSEQLAGLIALDAEFDTNIKAAWDWLVVERGWDEIIEKLLPGLFHYVNIRPRMEDFVPWLRDARIVMSPDSGIEEDLAYAIIGALEVLLEENTQLKDDDPIERLSEIWQFTVAHDLVDTMGFWFVPLALLVQARNLASGLEEQFERTVTKIRAQNDLWMLGICLLYQSNWEGEYIFDEAKLLEAEQIFKDLGVTYERGSVAQSLGRHAYQEKRPFHEVTAYYQQAKQFFEELGNQYYFNVNWIYLTGMYFQQGEPAQAFEILHEIHQQFEQVGNIRFLSQSLLWETLHAIRYSSFEHALDTGQRSLELAKKVGTQTDITWSSFELGETYRVFGEPLKANPFYEQAYRSFAKMNYVQGLGFYERAQGDFALQEARYEDALAHYRNFMQYAIQDNHAWSMAQSRAKMALVYAYLGDLEKARSEIQKTLAEIQDWGEKELRLWALLAEAVCLQQEGKSEQGIALAAFIQHHPVSWNETRQHARQILETALQDLPEKEVQAVIERGKALDFEEVVESFISQNKSS
jgi:predicted ATPase/DNA-binding SARP family transcriptional activator